MLLDELLAERERGQPVAPAPVLTVDPVAVPPTLESGRRAVRQRLADLESAARRNFRSAEEARRVLADEHERLQQEATARTQAQHEAAALRREVERLSTNEARRAAQERTRAERVARSQLSDELKQFQKEHELALQEMTELRSLLSEHDGLLDEYVTRLRDEQRARAELRAELEHAEAARSLAERVLERATESARQGAEDEMIRLATAEQQLVDLRSDRDRLAAQVAALTAGDGPIGRMTAQLEEKDAESSRLAVRVADLSARIDASEEAAQDALSERDDAVAARLGAEERCYESERARADAELAVDVAARRIGELEAELAERIATTDARTREVDAKLGQLRRQAREASSARLAAEEKLATAEAERDELRARVADLSAEGVRARADGDQLRAHAAILGDELSAMRATVAELQAADADAGGPLTDESSDETPQPARSAGDAFEVASEIPPPLPSRVAGRQAPAAPLSRRRPKREPATLGEVEYHVGFVPEVGQDEIDTEVEPPGVEPPEVECNDEAIPPETPEPVAVRPAPPRPTGEASRRTALAEFTALATANGDDFSFRRR
ncbi:MAG: hypothetical protein QOH28_741 [Actinomycetota bacterium]|nr:hypothetical protein [Actinomycetota bacterium]